MAWTVDSGGTLSNNLVCYHALEGLTDSFGTITLTNQGSVVIFNPAKNLNGADGTSNNTTSYLKNNTDLGIDGGTISMSFWFSPSAQPPVAGFLLVEQANSSISQVGNRIDYLQNGQIRYGRDKHNSAFDSLTINQTLTIGTFYHLVYTYDGINIQGWLNGASQGTAASPGIGVSGLFTGFGILNSSAGTSGPTSGIIDESAVWNRKLSTVEITDLYNGGTGSFYQNVASSGSTTINMMMYT